MVNSLEALHLILRAYGIGPGDEVIVPANTYIATWLAVSYAGAKPVPVEPDARTYNLDPALLEAAINPATKAILPVHLYGQSADMDPINSVAARHGLKVIEDAARRMERGIKVGGSAGWAMPPGSASIRARIWAHWGMAGQWSPMTPNWRSGCGCCADTGRG